jgi:hypothetical protein
MSPPSAARSLRDRIAQAGRVIKAGFAAHRKKIVPKAAYNLRAGEWQVDSDGFNGWQLIQILGSGASDFIC